MSVLQSWFGYGLGVGVVKAIFGEHEEARAPLREQTEEEILADEKRFAEDEKRLDAADAAAKARGGRPA